MATNSQRISIRVYYEDTDFSGRVYHVAYLRFFERGRTEWLRGFGIQHDELERTQGLTFAVTKLSVAFQAAAIIDDLLEVETQFTQLKGPRITFQQNIVCADRLIASGIVEVVSLRNNRASRPPRELTEVWRRKHWMPESYDR